MLRKKRGYRKYQPRARVLHDDEDSLTINSTRAYRTRCTNSRTHFGLRIRHTQGALCNRTWCLHSRSYKSCTSNELLSRAATIYLADLARSTIYDRLYTRARHNSFIMHHDQIHLGKFAIFHSYKTRGDPEYLVYM